MVLTKNDRIVLRGARILGGQFRNFGGERRPPYNKNGQRVFAVEIADPELAKAMSEIGWNIGVLEPREDGEPTYFVSVKIGFKADNPNIRHDPLVEQYSGKTIRDGKISYKYRTRLDAETIGGLDEAEIESAKVEISPRPWITDEGEEKISAWLRSLKVSISDMDEEDDDFPMYRDEEVPFD